MKIFIVKDKLSNTPAGVPFFSPQEKVLFVIVLFSLKVTKIL